MQVQFKHILVLSAVLVMGGCSTTSKHGRTFYEISDNPADYLQSTSRGPAQAQEQVAVTFAKNLATELYGAASAGNTALVQTAVNSVLSGSTVAIVTAQQITKFFSDAKNLAALQKALAKEKLNVTTSELKTQITKVSSGLTTSKVAPITAGPATSAIKAPMDARARILGGEFDTKGPESKHVASRAAQNLIDKGQGEFVDSLTPFIRNLDIIVQSDSRDAATQHANQSMLVASALVLFDLYGKDVVGNFSCANEGDMQGKAFGNAARMFAIAYKGIADKGNIESGKVLEYLSRALAQIKQTNWQDEVANVQAVTGLPCNVVSAGASAL